MERRLVTGAAAVAMAVVSVVGCVNVPSIAPNATPTPSPGATVASSELVLVETPFVDPRDLVPFVNAELGYQLLVPHYWGDGVDKQKYPSVHEFGSGRGFGTSGDPALKISMGASDGSIVLCQDIGAGCTTVVVTKLDELEAALVSVPTGGVASGVPGAKTGKIVLGDEVGGFKRPGYRRDATGSDPFGLGGTITGSCLGCPGVLYHAFTIKDGRPVVISIDWWTIAFVELPAAHIEDILAGFQFLD